MAAMYLDNNNVSIFVSSIVVVDWVCVVEVEGNFKVLYGL